MPGTLDAISALHAAGFLPGRDALFLGESYRFLRSVEARLRLMNTTARHDIPEDQTELTKLAYLLGFEGPDSVKQKCEYYANKNREYFTRMFDQAVN